MALHQLVYYSKSTQEFEIKELKEIAQKAEINNERLGISGALIYVEDVFLQLIEGGLVQLNELYRKISQDKRHNQLTILDFSKIKQRSFRSWKMKIIYLPNVVTMRETYFKYCPLDKFDPNMFDGDTARELLFELSQRQQK